MHREHGFAGRLARGAALLAGGAALLAGGATPAWAEDVILNVHNNYYQQVGIWVRSEQNHNPNPWVHHIVPRNGNGKILLRSPDRFIIVVDADGRRSRSKPVALKDYLTKHPKYVMKVSVTQLAGAPAGDPSSNYGSILQVEVAPGSDNNKPPAEDDRLELDFGPEPDTR
jgi:hypothetical protein